MSGTDPWGGYGSGSAGQWAPTPAPAGAPSQFGFGGAPPPPALTPAPPTNPPALWLVLAAVAALGGGAVAGLFGAELLPALGGWLLGGPVSFGLAAIFAWRDTLRRARPSPRVPGWVKPAYAVCLVLALLAILIASARLGLYFGYFFGEPG